jgi:flagellar hook assembly protein FlgD
MKNKIRFAYTILTILLIMLVAINLFGKQRNGFAEDDFTYEISYNLRTDGSVDFQIRTTSYNGQYAPQHCFAMWVTDENDNFVRTLEKRAYSYQQYLTYWYQMTGGNVNNALVTSASLNNHITHNINWDCTDSNLQPIPDGIYKIYIEFTESNASGVWHVVEFEKGEQPFELVTNGPNNFRDIELYYTPATSPDPVIEITSPADNSAIEILPFMVEFEVQNFDPSAGDGYIGLYINDQFNQVFTTLDPIEVTSFPQGSNELKLVLLDPVLAPLDPEVSDAITLIWNPISADDELITNTSRLLGNHPNPFNPSTEISFQISDSSNDAQIEIYNLKGQKVKTFPVILSEVEGLGKKHYSVTWNGTDDAGKPVSSGTYYYSLKQGNITDTKKMVLLK